MISMNEQTMYWRDGPQDYRPGKYHGYGHPPGPMGDEATGLTTAIGFCGLCGANARGTCRTRGVFDCPTCTMVWYDSRVGEQPVSIDDFFAEA